MSFLQPGIAGPGLVFLLGVLGVQSSLLHQVDFGPLSPRAYRVTHERKVPSEPTKSWHLLKQPGKDFPVIGILRLERVSPITPIAVARDHVVDFNHVTRIHVLLSVPTQQHRVGGSGWGQIIQQFKNAEGVHVVSNGDWIFTLERDNPMSNVLPGKNANPMPAAISSRIDEFQA